MLIFLLKLYCVIATILWFSFGIVIYMIKLGKIDMSRGHKESCGSRNTRSKKTRNSDK